MHIFFFINFGHSFFSFEAVSHQFSKVWRVLFYKGVANYCNILFGNNC